MNEWALSIVIIFVTYIMSLLITVVLTTAVLIGAQRKVVSFVCFNTVVFLWLFLDFYAQFISNSSEQQIFLIHAANFSSSFIAPSLLWVAADLLKNIRLRLVWLFAVASFILGSISSMPFANLKLDVSREGIAIESAPIIYQLFLLATFTTIALLIIKIWRYEHRRATKPSRAVRSLMLALTVMLSLNLLGAFVFAQFKWSQILAPLSMVIVSQVLAVSIFKQKLIFIRQFVVRALVYLTLYSATVGISVLAAILVLNHTILRTQQLSLVQIFSYSLLALLLIGIQPYLRKLFDKITDWLFYRESYDPQLLLEDLNDRLNGELDVLQVSHILVNYLKQNLKLSQVAVALADGKLIASDQQYLAILNSVNTEASKFSQSLVTIEFASSKPKMQLLADLMQEANIVVISTMKDKTSNIGKIFYSSKLSGESFHTRDLQLMELIADQVTLILENALKFEEIASFNITLQQEVKHATERLRHANNRLKILDKLKDDFISVASHQFRTPAGSIRQAFKMSHDPNMSAEDREEVLRLAEVNSEQLSSLVNTMLDISRIEAGRFTLTRSLADMSGIVDKIIAATDIVAEQKDITLNFKRPTQTILLNVDRGKISEAMKNYVENAVKYSPTGSTVTIDLFEKDNTVYFEVSDKGMGVPEKDRHSLFGKYYRAENAREFQPDGNGIGLYVVKNIVEGHEGSVYYRALETGSLFGFSIPAETTKSLNLLR